MPVIRGTEAADALRGGPGGDALVGLGGNDTLAGASGADRLFGGAGNDQLLGDDRGDVGDPDIVGGADTLFGGAGDDRFGSFVDGPDLAYGGAGADRFDVVGNSVGAQGIERDAEGLRLFGGEGDDEFVLDGVVRDLRAEGGAGADRLTLRLTNVDRLDGYSAVMTPGPDGPVTIVRFGATLVARLVGVEGVTVEGGEGTARVVTLGGDDVVRVASGVVSTGAGDDLVSVFSSGASTLDGGLGIDRLELSLPDDAGAALDVLAGRSGNIRWAGFETFAVRARARDDLMLLGRGDDSANGGSGDDRLEGRDGADRLTGGDGADVLRGQTGSDVLVGDGGDDRLFGGYGRDSLRGGAGDDVIDGGDGWGRLRGGSGADTFVLAPSRVGHERIADFVSGEDRIGIGFDVAGWTRGALPPGLLRRGEPSGTGDQFVLVAEGADTRLVFVDGGARVTLAVFEDVSGLSASDFVLL